MVRSGSAPFPDAPDAYSAQNERAFRGSVRAALAAALSVEDSAQPDILFLTAVVNQDDGSVIVTGRAAANILSVAYAFNVATSGAATLPLVADAESQGGTADGGDLEVVSGAFEFTLSAGTVDYGEEIRLLAIGYVNDDGTGADGTETDHGEPMGAQGSRFIVSSSDQVADGVIVARTLTAGMQRFISTVVFSATDWNTAQWSTGDLTTADGTVYSIASGNTGNLGDDALRYVYFDKNVSTTVLQVTTNYASVQDDETVLLCVVKRAPDSAQNVFYIPAVGIFGVNSAGIGQNSIEATHIKAGILTAYHIQAASITGAEIDAATLNASHIATLDLDVLGSAVVGTLHADVIIASELFTATNAVFENAIEVRAGEGAPRVVIDQASGAGAVTLRDSSGNVAGSMIGFGTRTLSIGGVDALLLGDSEDVYLKSELVSFGASDSAGTGYRLVRVPN